MNVIRSASRSRHIAFACLFLACAGSISACATTGDPGKGGLWGWSENKAKTRQMQLSQAEAVQRQRAANEQQRGDRLRQQQSSLGDEALQLQAELDGLRAENRKLDAQLRELLRKRTLRADEMHRLQGLLADNQQLLSKALAPADDSGAPTNADVDALNGQNSRLHRELLALLQR